MSSVEAVTQNLTLVVRVASFYPLSSEATKEIVEEVSKVMSEMGKKHSFLVWKTALELRNEHDKRNET